MTIRAVIIHNDVTKGKAIEEAMSGDRKVSIKGTYRKSSEALSYILGSDLNLIVLSDMLDNMTSYEFIMNLMKSKPVACLVLTELGNETPMDQPRALDYSIVDTYAAEYKNDKLLFPARMMIKVKILSKLNIERFRTQIDQINNYDPNRAQRQSLGSSETAEKMQELRSKTSIEKIIANKPKVLEIPSGRKYDSIVVIGASTGGPRLLVYIVSQLPVNFPPVLIVQHMPQGFVGAFASRMNDNSRINVKKAEDGDKIVAGNVYIAPGGYHLELERVGGDVYARITDGPKVNFVKPAVDVTLFSAARVFGSKTISVVLTGMGSDGREGSRIVKKRGGSVVCLNEEDSVIFGMNKSVVDAGLADEVVGMDGIVGAIGNYLNKN